MVLAAFPNATLTIIGSGPEKSALESCVESLGLAKAVRFFGALPQIELPLHYRRATLFVAPFIEAAGGDQEGFGLVVAEAMACECPVIVGDVRAVHDVIGDDCGVQVNAKDHAALASAIIALLQDEHRRTQIGSMGRARVLERFDWSAVAARYASLIQSLADGTDS